MQRGSSLKEDALRDADAHDSDALCDPRCADADGALRDAHRDSRDAVVDCDALGDARYGDCDCDALGDGDVDVDGNARDGDAPGDAINDDIDHDGIDKEKHQNEVDLRLRLR